MTGESAEQQRRAGAGAAARRMVPAERGQDQSGSSRGSVWGSVAGARTVKDRPYIKISESLPRVISGAKNNLTI